MRCDSVEIDDELFAAQDQRRLVVFAGAGISMGLPSNLPSFRQLVHQIADGTLPPGSEHENPLEILGRLKFGGVDVHERCRGIIAHPDSRPTPLHSAILRLFRDPNDIRVVTSNFDPHFSTSASALNLVVPVHRSPALPLGYDFNGIVHLHGSIAEASRMILTDDDFGAAYMSDGWVARFLRDLLATYTVLFVGYSHTDPPMNFFNLGLGVRRHRHYILTAEDVPDQWRRLHLAPLLYQTEANGTDHSKLTLAVENWAEQTALRPREVAARLQQILANPTVLSPSDEGFLLRHYNREHTVGAFVDHAQLFDWVPWMHQKNLVRSLLSDPTSNNENGALSFWLGRTLAKDGSGVGLGIVEQCGGILNFQAARGVLIELLNSIEKAPPTQAQKHWLRLLLRQSPATYLAVYARLMTLLQKNDEWPLALEVVAFLIRPSIRYPTDNRPNEHFIGNGPFPTLTGERFDLTQTLDEAQLLAGKNTDRQLELLQVLEQACLLLGEQCELLGLNNHHQPGLVSFESILASDGRDESPMGALIRFTCQFALSLATSAKLNKDTFIRWMDSKNQILIRCSLLCLEKSQLTASEKLDILINHNGLYPLAFRADMEREPLIHAIYPLLSDLQKQAFWDTVNRGPSTEWERGAPDE